MNESNKLESASNNGDTIHSDNANRTGDDAPRASEQLNVFVSYRIDPDAPLASALKILIEGAIDPQPMVFVSGSGGLRPSNLGFKKQLQDAAQSAHAFVALITNSSKDREWIFFEAGAAWGRDLIYAPVLVGSRPNELPATIGDYQALNAQSKDDMLKLVTALAERVGAEVRGQFGRRYQPFSRKLDQYLSGELDNEKGAQSNELHKAYRLGIQGEIDASNEIFDRLESEAQGPEERCQIRVFRIWAQKKPNDISRYPDEFDSTLQNTTTFNLHMGLDSKRPQVRYKYFERAIEIGEGSNATQAQVERAQLDFELGDKKRAIESLMDVIRLESGRARNLREKAAKVLADSIQSLSEFEKLLINLAGLSGSTAEGYQPISDQAAKNNWNILSLLASKRVLSLDESGISLNACGIAQARLKLFSLAYRSYSKAAKLGVSVARCNMAGLLQSEAAASAGLSILDEHKARFDAADSGYPYAFCVLNLNAKKTTNEDANGRYWRRQTGSSLRYGALPNARSPHGAKGSRKFEDTLNVGAQRSLSMAATSTWPPLRNGRLPRPRSLD